MAKQNYQDKRTKLPRTLLEQVNARDENITSGVPTSQRRPTDRRSARKSKREEASIRKNQYFSGHKRVVDRSSISRKRVMAEADNRPPKRPKLNEAPTRSLLTEPSASPSTAPTKTVLTSAVCSKPGVKPKPTTTQRSTTKQPTSISLPKSRARQKDAEDDEIAWLEAKLGLRSKKKGKRKYDGAFGADGLDDILLDLDNLEEDIYVVDEETQKKSDDEVENGGIGEDEDDEAELTSDHDGPNSASADEETSENESDEEVPALVGLNSEPQTSSKSTTDAYIPPHLRQETATSGSDAVDSQTFVQTKLTRQLKGLLNRLSEQNIEGIVTEVETLYRSNPRKDVTQALTSILLGSVSSSTNLLDTFVILHAAFVAAMHKIIGIEFAAYFIEQAVSSYEIHWKSLRSVASQDSMEDSAPAGTKESSNLLVLISELYNFHVVSCVLIYDLIRALLSSEFLEHDVELLLRVVKNSGQQMRQDDPLALKDIIQLVQDKMRGKGTNELSSRFRFMVETLINLKNNKLKDAKRTTGTGQNVAAQAIERMKKYLSGIDKKRHVMSHEPLRVSLQDLHSSAKRGKWWLVGSAWGGDPLLENQSSRAESRKQDAPKSKTSTADQLVELARQHGMNTEIRQNIFVVLVSSDDYVDACERFTQLDLQETQQREIVRVVLHCCGNERIYNPFYTLVVHHICQASHSHRITLQYWLWDFLRSLGESRVGGATMSQDFDTSGKVISDSRMANYAKAYAWWLARGSLSMTVFKPVEFLTLQPRSARFLKHLFLQLIISSQTNSPLADIKSPESAIPQTRDRAAIEEVMSKALRISTMCKGVSYFVQSLLSEQNFGTETKRASELLKWGLNVAKESLQRESLLEDDL